MHPGTTASRPTTSTFGRRALAPLTVVALLASLCVVLTPTTTSAVPAPRAASAADRIPLPVVSRAQAKARLQKVRSLISTPRTRQEARSRSRSAGSDLTMALRDLRLAQPSLTPGDRATAEAILARPGPSRNNVDPFGYGSAPMVQRCSSRVCVHYTRVGPEAATDTQAAATLRTMDYVYNREVYGLKYRSPRSDAGVAAGASNPDGRFDVFLADVGRLGYFGYCATDTVARVSAAYCVLDDDFAVAQFGIHPTRALQATAAHEFFHAIQFNYDAAEDMWFMEGSATWAEDMVFPTVNDHLRYLRYSAIKRPRIPGDFQGDAGVYGAFAMFRYLSDRYGVHMVRRVWDYAASPARYSLQAYRAAVSSAGDWTYAFALFGAWNTLPPGSYGERASYGAPVYWRTVSLSRRRRAGGTHSVTVPHLSTATMRVLPASTLPRRARLRVIVNAPPTSAGSAALVQTRYRNGAVGYVRVRLNSSGDGRVRIPFNRSRVSSAVVVLSNTSTALRCGSDPQWRYSCGGTSPYDRGLFRVKVTTR